MDDTSPITYLEIVRLRDKLMPSDLLEQCLGTITLVWDTQLIHYYGLHDYFC